MANIPTRDTKYTLSWETIGVSYFEADNFGIRPLHIAVAKKNKTMAAMLLHNNARVDLADGKLMTPLHRAADIGDVEMIKLLLSHGADPNMLEVFGWSPSMIAASNGDTTCLQALISGGADLTISNSAGDALSCAASNGHTEAFVLISANGGSLYPISDRSYSILEDAFASDSASLHTYILHAISDFSLYGASKYNSLAPVAWRWRPRLLKRLLRRLPKELVERLLKSSNSREVTPLYAAVIGSSIRNVEILFDEGADVDIEEGCYGTPLIAACAMGRLSIVQLLIGKGARTSYIDKDGKFQCV